MLIHQDLEFADQTEATWDGALNTCMAEHSHSHNPPFLLQGASRGRHFVLPLAISWIS